jgi:hypothetical protein
MDHVERNPSTALLKELIAAQLAEKLPAFNGTQKFLTVFTAAQC